MTDPEFKVTLNGVELPGVCEIRAGWRDGIVPGRPRKSFPAFVIELYGRLGKHNTRVPLVHAWETLHEFTVHDEKEPAPDLETQWRVPTIGFQSLDDYADWEGIALPPMSDEKETKE